MSFINKYYLCHKEPIMYSLNITTNKQNNE